MNLKRLVLGAAAGALAVTGASGAAQAADLPVVVDPVDYVRICDAYGTGYFFIPGTETCLRIAGRVRADYNIFIDFDQNINYPRPGVVPPFGAVGAGGNYINSFPNDLTAGFGFNNGDRSYRFRARGYIYLESRTATEFGLLRTFTEVQFTRDNAGITGTALDSAVIQFGGLIFGRTDSLYDFNDADIGSSQFFSYLHSDTKINLVGYQAAFGNGFSVAVSLEDNATRQGGILQFANGAIVPGAGIANANRTSGFFNRQDVETIPDIVGNIRVDQGWGSAQLMAAGHYVDATGVTFNTPLVAGGGLQPRGSGNRDEYGFAVGAGVSVNVPFGTGTTAALTGTYAHGAVSYAAAGATGPAAVDAVITPNGSLDLGDFFSVSGGIATSFTPTIALALQGGYLNADFANVQIDPANGVNTLQDSVDFENWALEGFLGYSPVAGMTFGVGAQFLYVDTDDFGDTSALSTFFRAQRTF